MKRLRYTVFILAAVLIGLVITKAVIVDAETDKQLEQIDKFIETHETKKSLRTPKNDTEIVETAEIMQFETVSEHYFDVEEETTLAQEETTLVEDLVQEELVNYSTELDITPEEFRILGVIDWGEWRYTYYSEQVLPGEGLNIPGRWSDGTFVRDENGYLCVASNVNDLPFGTCVETPFGTGIVYDCGCDPGIIDIYVSFN